MRETVPRRAAGVSLFDAGRLGDEPVERSRPSIAWLDRLSGSHLGGSLERGRGLLARRHDHSIRQRLGVAACGRSADRRAGGETPLPNSTTVTRTTTVRPGVVAAAPVYDELKRGPRLYDVATPAAVAPAVQPAVPAAPVLGATTAVGGPVAMPTYRYVYQPDRILVIDPYTNITVQTIPR